jgi:DMSO/TMAO reductase YedYZ molybdopterin-dependent catalytic subunit
MESSVVSSILVVTMLAAFATGQEGLAPELVEIREYEGQALSSIDSFRENSIAGSQEVDVESYRLKITGLVDTTIELTYEEITGGFESHERVVTLDCVEGWSVTILWEGVRMRELFERAGPTEEAKVVILRAADGYSTSFPLSYFQENDILLALKMNGVPLPPERGFPFQLVAEGKWGYKWIKWVAEIEFSDDESHRGFWESRGYSSDGDLEKSFFDK